MEFDLIRKYFATQPVHRKDVVLGIGDDAAILTTPLNHQLIVTTDTLVAGVHFFSEANPADIGHKALAVNLSDLAAMGATPHWVTLALTLPTVDEPWLQAFCENFYALAQPFNTQLIGGDLTKGPLSITITALGFVPQGCALRRDTAKINDDIYVTGTLGDAGYVLKNIHSKTLPRDMQDRLHRPTPRVAAGIQLREMAHAAIDISDGFVADLQHILEASQLGAEINVDLMPVSQSLLQQTTIDDAILLALTSGDDYELCFTADSNQAQPIQQLFSQLKLPVTRVGKITATRKLALKDKNGTPYFITRGGYEHF